MNDLSLSLEDIAKVEVGKSNRSYEGEDDSNSKKTKCTTGIPKLESRTYFEDILKEHIGALHPNIFPSVHERCGGKYDKERKIIRFQHHGRTAVVAMIKEANPPNSIPSSKHSEYGQHLPTPDPNSPHAKATSDHRPGPNTSNAHGREPKYCQSWKNIRMEVMQRYREEHFISPVLEQVTDNCPCKKRSSGDAHEVGEYEVGAHVWIYDEHGTLIGLGIIRCCIGCNGWRRRCPPRCATWVVPIVYFGGEDLTKHWAVGCLMAEAVEVDEEGEKADSSSSSSVTSSTATSSTAMSSSSVPVPHVRRLQELLSVSEVWHDATEDGGTTHARGHGMNLNGNMEPVDLVVNKADPERYLFLLLKMMSRFRIIGIEETLESGRVIYPHLLPVRTTATGGAFD